jgi:hypothetical protein
MADLFKHPFLALVVLGGIALLIAATGVVPISVPPVAITSNSWRMVIALIGSIFVAVGLWGIFRVKPKSTDHILTETKGKTDPYIQVRPPLPIIIPKRLPKYAKVQLQSEPIAIIKIISGPLTNSWILITETTGRITFGRGPKVDISFEKSINVDDFVSINHFVLNVGTIENIRTKRPTYKIKILDFNSDNGTFINKKRIPYNTAIELIDGDEIWLGNSVLVFKKI